ncbi:MAG: TRAP transporter small permease, partial [Rhodospirillales bacterium]|nr:TRAP transporter small permease [Rhodospirillales bacterium]
MSEGFEEEVPRPTDKVGRVLFTLARALALFGGVVIGAMAIMTTISIFGRAFLSSPIPGDIELIEIGTGTAVFAFLPYCQMMRGNIIVDFFLTSAPYRVKSFFDFIGGVMFLIIGCLLNWRMVYGGIDMYQYAETTGVLAIPRWISFPYGVACLSFLVVVVIY